MRRHDKSPVPVSDETVPTQSGRAPGRGSAVQRRFAGVTPNATPTTHAESQARAEAHDAAQAARPAQVDPFAMSYAQGGGAAVQRRVLDDAIDAPASDSIMETRATINTAQESGGLSGRRLAKAQRRNPHWSRRLHFSPADFGSSAAANSAAFANDVARFQRDHGLAADGIAGPKTHRSAAANQLEPGLLGPADELEPGLLGPADELEPGLLGPADELEPGLLGGSDGQLESGLIGMDDPLFTGRPRAARNANTLESGLLGEVQGKGIDGPDSDAVHTAAAEGIQGAGQELPFRGQIEASTGQDLSGVKAHVGGQGAVASAAMGAQAYATGDNVVFAQQPDLHTAAHEATHVLQQRDGVQLKGGVGEVGDAYEVQADQVADRVVRGELAGDLLAPGRTARSSALGAGPVQKIDALVSKDASQDRRRHGASSQGNPAFSANGYRYTNSEMDRQEDLGNAAVTRYAGQVAKTDVADEQPQPMPNYLGYPSYYQARVNDFQRRNGPGVTAPDYYIDYGRRYALKFTNDLFPKLSEKGKVWLIKTRTNLQLKIENKLLADPKGFAKLERQNDAFRSFCFDSHPSAYLESGLRELSVGDHIQIALTPDIGDLLSWDGLAQMSVIGPELAEQYARRAAREILPVLSPGLDLLRGLFD